MTNPLDLNAVNPAVTPATPEIQYPLNYMVQAHFDGDNHVMRAYILLDPYRRIMGPVLQTPAQPILDAEGKPVLTPLVYLLDEQGQQVLTPLEYQLGPDGEPVLDAEGNMTVIGGGQPIVIGGGEPTFTEPVYIEGVVDGEVKPTVTGTDRKEIIIPNIHAVATPDPAGEALIIQTIGQFIAQGGNIFALTMAAMTISVNEYGKATGVLKA